MNKKCKYSIYGFVDGFIMLLMLVLGVITFTKYNFNIITSTYYIFIIVSIFIHFKISSIKLYKSKDKINYIYTICEILYIKFSQLVIIVLMYSYYKINVFNEENTITMINIIVINILISLFLTYIIKHRSYITNYNQVYINHSYIVNIEEITEFRLGISKIGGKSVYMALPGFNQIKTELSTNDYDFLLDKMKE